MRIPTQSRAMFLAIAAASLLSACGGGGLFNRERPDEFAVQRQTPLVVPPDFALTPPKQGEPARPSARFRTKRSTPCSAALHRVARWNATPSAAPDKRRPAFVRRSAMRRLTR